jgi:phosphoribosylformylglycinamidine synthase subunit PurQ / glutaminase
MVRIAVVSFPGNNCEVESIRALKRVGIEPLFFRWNDDRAKLQGVDGYVIPGGFSYEDRGRAGMIAARDPLLDFIGREASDGKVVIGNCNGAQILVESGLIPLGTELRMSLAKNVVDTCAMGFLNEWVWVKPTCAKNRCATSNWTTPIHMPIAHGEGRFTTKDRDLLTALKCNDQLAFSYCSEDGNVSEDPFVTPNGSTWAIAGICNPAGNVVALMPHPERTVRGDPYFVSVKKWIERYSKFPVPSSQLIHRKTMDLLQAQAQEVEIFIDTIITNNEERTVEKVARSIVPSLQLKQLRYLIPSSDPKQVLGKISVFNPNKEIAYIRRGKEIFRWNANEKNEEQINQHPLRKTMLLRIDEPDTQKGICYVCEHISNDDLHNASLLQVFSNSHASTLTRLTGA